MNPIHHLQLKFITEPDFRQKFLDDPATALKEIGIEPTDELLSIIADLRADLEKLAEQLGVSKYFA